MTGKEQKSAQLVPIDDANVALAAAFLNQHMNSRFPVSRWEAALQTGSLKCAPNHGFMLHSVEGNIVGVICAIYSEQLINEKSEFVCNLHSWVVLPEYRKQSVSLVVAAIRQPELHFTMFTPNEDGLEIFKFLKFKHLGNSTTLLLNMPSIFGRGKMLFQNNENDLSGQLTAYQNTIYSDHFEYSWLDKLFFSCEGESGFILYHKEKYKKLPCARILYVSNWPLFTKHWIQIRTYLFCSLGMVSSKVETRFLKDTWKFAIAQQEDQQKFYLSPSLAPSDIQCIYSELMALDLYR